MFRSNSVGGGGQHAELEVSSKPGGIDAPSMEQKSMDGGGILIDDMVPPAEELESEGTEWSTGVDCQWVLGF